MQDIQFRKHLMKFVALGKPVVCIPWASDPHWPGDIQSRVLNVSEALRGKRAFYVRLEMENRADRAGLAGNRIDRLRVECVHRSPPLGSTAELIADDSGNLSYEDDFSTTRWRHFGEMKAAHQSYGGWRGDEFWVGMVGGYAISTVLLQRFSSPRPLKELVVTADCYADGKNLGGRAVLQVGPRDSEPKWQIPGIHLMC